MSVFHPRRAASWILGSWLGASLFMIGVATRNFRMVDSLIANPSAGLRERLERFGEAEVRLILRHQASELNQLYFSTFEVAELFCAVLLAVVAFRSLGESRLLKLAALLLGALLVVEHFVLTPEIARLGRLADFRMLQPGSPEYGRFWTYHGAYSTLELAKIALLVVASIRLLWNRRDLPV
jgi:hypothetical protein